MFLYEFYDQKVSKHISISVVTVFDVLTHIQDAFEQDLQGGRLYLTPRAGYPTIGRW